MIALTQDKREELIKYTKERLASHVIHGGCSDEEDILKIALASLTAAPFGWEIAGNIFPTLEEALKPGYIGTPEPIYDEPPVQGIKDHEIREMVNEITSTAVKYSGCQCLRDAISKVVIKRLNGLGE